MTIEKCSLCGLCKANCVSFKLTKKESRSPRGRAYMIKRGVVDKSFYLCTLCLACVEECPAKAELPLREQREKLVKEGKETKVGREMIRNVREFGNPYGKLEKGEKPKRLY